MIYNKEVGIIGSFTKKGQRILFQYPNLLVTPDTSNYLTESVKKTTRTKKQSKIKTIKRERLDKLSTKRHFFCKVLASNPVLDSVLSEQSESN